MSIRNGQIRNPEENPPFPGHDKDFWHNIPKDCVKAVKELWRLKVSGLAAWDYEETFADVWWAILHEVDMYNEGEFCREAYRSVWGEGDPQAMNLRAAQAADRWLVRWNDLAIKYSRPGCFSAYHDRYIGWFGDGIDCYSGQLI